MAKPIEPIYRQFGAKIEALREAVGINQFADKGYRKRNCRWSTPSEQNKNRRTVRVLQERIDLLESIIRKLIHV